MTDTLTLTWYGTASLVIQAQGERVAFDPFAGIPIGRREQKRQLERVKPAASAASHVFVTHGHLDHICHIPDFYADGSARIYATGLPCRTLRREGLPPEQLVQIGPGWQGNVGPFTLRAWQSRHCKFDLPLILNTIFSPGPWLHLPHLLRLGRLNRRYPEGGEILFYQLGYGPMRVQIMGSLGLDPQVSYPTGADLLVLPFQGRSDLERYAMGIVERLRPRAIALDHWDDSFPPLSSTVETGKFQRRVEENMGIPCRPLQWGELVVLRTERKGG